MIDNEAYEHIICDRKYFWDMYNADQINVEMADSATLLSDEKESVPVIPHEGIAPHVCDIY